MHQFIALRRCAVGCSVVLVLLWGALGRAQDCVGDWAGDGRVTIDDLIRGVNIALGGPALSTCAALDANADGTVSIDELVRAVSAALMGCPTAPTLTATLLAADTATPLAADTPTQPPASPTASALPASPTATATGTSPPTETPPATAPTATPTETPPPSPSETPSSPTFCNLPGALQFTGPGMAVVPGGPADAPSLEFLTLPVGFCAHYYGRVGNARLLRFAPGGELFVASPTKFTTGNGQNGRAAIVVLPDDDGDGSADTLLTYLAGLPATQGLLFHDGHLYYQDDKRILRVPYTAGDRAATVASEEVANITVYSSTLHWPKTLDVADDGTIYVGNGGDEGESCRPADRPFHGGILKLDGSPGGASTVAKGFRNPMAVRCAKGYGSCFAIELARDYTTMLAGREKLVPIRDGDDWGFPCCASKDTPYADLDPPPDCSGVSQEIDSFYIGHTPFDLDFETQRWPEPWTHRAFVPLHGIYGTWKGARLVGIDFDVMSGQPLPGSDLTGMSSGAMQDFATGWDDGTRTHGRPANVAFAPDGRLFLSNDRTGDIIWIAPFGLTQ
jgi:glucose/arabinose dehydrogenase